jgi:hypothetical protein
VCSRIRRTDHRDAVLRSIHGDLSPYNIPPQRTGRRSSIFRRYGGTARAEFFFLRDFDNVVQFVSRFDPRPRSTATGGDLARVRRHDLTRESCHRHHNDRRTSDAEWRASVRRQAATGARSRPRGNNGRTISAVTHGRVDPTIGRNPALREPVTREGRTGPMPDGIAKRGRITQPRGAEGTRAEWARSASTTDQRPATDATAATIRRRGVAERARSASTDHSGERIATAAATDAARWPNRPDPRSTHRPATGERIATACSDPMPRDQTDPIREHVPTSDPRMDRNSRSDPMPRDERT